MGMFEFTTVGYGGSCVDVGKDVVIWIVIQKI